MSTSVNNSSCSWTLGRTGRFLVTIPQSNDHLCSYTRTCEDSHQKCMEGTCERVGVHGEPPRGARGEWRCAAREVSFICIWHTSLLCYSSSTIILITVCLSLPLYPLLFLLLQFLRSEKMRWLVYRQICTSPTEGRKSLCVVTGFKF